MQQIVQAYGPFIAMMALGIGLIATVGWVFTTWLRIKHGYPLDGAWGQAVFAALRRDRPVSWQDEPPTAWSAGGRRRSSATSRRTAACS